MKQLKKGKVLSHKCHKIDLYTLKAKQGPRLGPELEQEVFCQEQEVFCQEHKNNRKKWIFIKQLKS